MENLDVFDFDNLKKTLNEDPFAQTNAFKTDERFYTLPKDENGSGSALIAFLPDQDLRLVQKMNKINTAIGKKFVNEWSPTTIGLPDPFHEKWQELYNSGRTDEARVFSRSVRYITLIKVIKDPKKPENNGKIFFYDMSQKMLDKIKQALEPSEQDLALGGSEKLEVFNPLKGVHMKLIAQKGANGITNYDSSSFVKLQPIYSSKEEYDSDVREHGYRLNDLVKPEAFKSYDELKKKLDWVTNTTSKSETPVVAEATRETEVISQPSQSSQQVQHAQQQKVEQTQTSKSESIDDLLDGLI